LLVGGRQKARQKLASQGSRQEARRKLLESWPVKEKGEHPWWKRLSRAVVAELHAESRNIMRVSESMGQKKARTAYKRVLPSWG